MSIRSLMSRQTLRTRLTLLLATLLLVSCAAVGIATSLALRSFLVTRLDQQFDLAGSRYVTALEHNHNDADNPEMSTIGQQVGTLGSRILGGTVTAIGVVSESNAPVQITASDRTAIAALTPTDRNRTIELSNLGKYRVRVTAGNDGDILVTGLPQHPIDETLHHVVLAETIVFLIVVAITASSADSLCTGR